MTSRTDPRRRGNLPERVRTPLLAISLAAVVADTLVRHPGPVALAVLTLFAATAAVLVGGRFVLGTGRLAFAFFAMFGAASIALTALTRGGQAYIGLFMVIGAAPVRFPPRLARWLVVPCGVSITVLSAVGSQEPLLDGLVTAAGVCFFAFIGQATRRNRLLIAELQESREAEARSAVLGERARIARELHDVLAHTLSGLALHLESTRLLAERTGAAEEVRAGLARGAGLARSGLDEARRAVEALREAPLPGPERLPQLVAGFERDSGVPAYYAVAGAERALPPQTRVTLYRAAQEALTNVGKHARPKRVDVELCWRPDEVALRVEDVGSPGDGPLAAIGAGAGLLGMRERVALAGGHLDVGPTGEGWRVELRLPA